MSQMKDLFRRAFTELEAIRKLAVPMPRATQVAEEPVGPQPALVAAVERGECRPTERSGSRNRGP